MELVFAVLLGVIAVWAGWSAVQSLRTASTVAIGYAIIAISAVVQILHIIGQLGTAYSLTISIATTLGLVVGFLMTRRRVVPPVA